MSAGNLSTDNSSLQNFLGYATHNLFQGMERKPAAAVGASVPDLSVGTLSSLMSLPQLGTASSFDFSRVSILILLHRAGLLSLLQLGMLARFLASSSQPYLLLRPVDTESPVTFTDSGIIYISGAQVTSIIRRRK